MRISLEAALNRLLQKAVGRLYPASAPKELRWEFPKEPAFGELSCPIAFKLASQGAQVPGEVAERLVSALGDVLQCSTWGGLVDRLEARRGFVNVFLSQRALIEVLTQINHAKARYGTSRLGRGGKVLIEFVSANPTGPLSVAHGRQAAVGDALARILRSQGYRVTTEYYLNDEGRQIDLLGRSLRARCLERLGRFEPLPEDGYQGEYLIQTAARLVWRHQDRLLKRPLAWFVAKGVEEQSQGIKQDLARFGLAFNRWSSERWLRRSGRVERALGLLRDKGALYDSEGATWFASTRFGDDKDRVVRRQSGELTYLAPDIAYHHWKFQRGFELLINLWGPDHHGYVPRVKAAVSALGLPADRLVIRIVQLVTLSRKGKPVPMSKRQGEFVTFREILDEVGVDATRFFYLMRTMECHLDFDLDLAKAQVQENPVYYVQYAHARICSILRYARKQLPPRKRLGRVDLSCLNAQEERLLLRQLFQFPMTVRVCALNYEPHGLTVYLQKLAELFHAFYTKHRVISEDVALSCARLALVQGSRHVLANGLGLIGIAAPRKM